MEMLATFGNEACVNVIFSPDSNSAPVQKCFLLEQNMSRLCRNSTGVFQNKIYLSTFQQGVWAKILIIKLFGVCGRAIKKRKIKDFINHFSTGIIKRNYITLI